MDALLASLAPHALLFMLIATRLSAMMMVAPFFQTRTIPARVKAGFVVLASYVCLPIVAAQGGEVPDSVVAVGLLAGKEMLIGVAFGLVAQMLFAAVQLAGALIDIGAGFAIANVIDPSAGSSITVLGRFYSLIAGAVFVAVGGHQWLVAGIVKSFAIAPPLETPRFDALLTGVLAHADDIVLVAVWIGAPILAALFIADVALGIVARSVPQMNVFIVGLPLKIVIALAGIAILLPTTVAFLGDLTGRMTGDLSEMIRAAGGP